MSEKKKAKKVQDLFSLKERVALVTGGAGSGYGAQIVEALAEAGAKVFITSRDSLKAHAAAHKLQAKGFPAKALSLDLEQEDTILAAIEALVQDCGRLDILVNNASGNHLEPFETVSLEDWNRVISINITGTMLLSRAVAPVMMNGMGGSIINLSSIYGIVSPDQRIYGRSGLNSPLVYGVTKAAIIQMTRYLATYWAPHIRVNCIIPGGLFAGQDENFVKNYVAKTPLGRMAGPEDLKGGVLYLASDASAWVTGQNLIIDGGWTVW